jgi:uncharacterized protein (DUF983 family)
MTRQGAGEKEMDMQANEVSHSPIQFGKPHTAPPAERPVGRSIKRGLLSRCPACGKGKLFRSYVKPVDTCAACGEDLSPQRSDDFPPYLVITIVGHITLGGYMMTDLVWSLTTWQHLAIWVPVTILSALLLLQPIKGGVIALQWAMRMHGFNDKVEEPAPASDTVA